MQDLKVIDKQLILQKQDQDLSNTNMATILCTIEEIYNRKFQNNKTNFFDYYDVNSFRTKKSDEELAKQLKTQFHVFKNSYKIYCIEYGRSYDFPENFEKVKLLEMINIWENADDNKSICNELKKLLDEDFSTIAEEKLADNEDINQIGKIDISLGKDIPLNILFNQIPNLVYYSDSVYEKVEKEIENTGNYKTTLNIGDSSDNNFIKNNIQIFEEANGKNDEDIKKNKIVDEDLIRDTNAVMFI